MKTTPTDVEPECDGLCIRACDILPGYGYEVAYPHPGCPLHAPSQECDCGTPDRCLSPTHGQIDLDEALAIKNRQRDQRISNAYD